MNAFSACICIFVAAALTACKPTPEKNDAAQKAGNGRLQIHVANYPLAYFTERIGSTEVDVIFAAPPVEDPAFWEPTDKDIAAMQGADLIVMNGATYSKWADKVSLPEAKVLDTSASFKPQ